MILKNKYKKIYDYKQTIEICRKLYFINFVNENFLVKI